MDQHTKKNPEIILFLKPRTLAMSRTTEIKDTSDVSSAME